jgi:hypothetical protein
LVLLSIIILIPQIILCYSVYFMNNYKINKLPIRICLIFNKYSHLVFILYYFFFFYFFFNFLFISSLFDYRAVSVFYNLGLVLIFIFFYLYVSRASYFYSILTSILYNLFILALLSDNILSMFILLEIINLVICALFLEGFRNSKTNSFMYIYNFLVSNFIISSIFFLYIIYFYRYFGTLSLKSLILFGGNTNISYIFMLIFLLKLNINPFFFLYSKIYRNISVESLVVYTFYTFFYLFFIVIFLPPISINTKAIILVYSTFIIIASSLNTNSKFDFLLLSSQIVNSLFLIIIIWC